MTNKQDKRLADLEANTNRTPEEEALRVALVALEAAEKAVEDAEDAVKAA